ncbi:MAG: hypothetical protein F4Y38_00740 [Gemmatimonadetes bacterium]|nr:hypothetical protein [Gemmatimonadota bacterium]MYG86366.1 hypothetical protein [Gemmatimonadota bacterium]MYJ91210.1 hypothetical protein [Gemmatimonadota bacterium]
MAERTAARTRSSSILRGRVGLTAQRLEARRLEARRLEAQRLEARRLEARWASPGPGNDIPVNYQTGSARSVSRTSGSWR